MINIFIPINAFVDAITADTTYCNSDVPEGTDISLNAIMRGLRNNLEQQIFEQPNKEALRLLIAHSQKKLTVLADKVYQMFLKKTENKEQPISSKGQLFKQIGLAVTDLLQYLHANYSEFFDVRYRISPWISFCSKPGLEKRVYVRRAFRKKHIDPELCGIVFDYLDCLEKPGNFRIGNWQQYDYLEVFTSMVYRFSRDAPSDNDTLRLIRLLIGYNFNPFVFYKFMEKFSRELSEEEPSFEFEQVVLLRLIRDIENIRNECDAGYSLSVEPIRESVIRFLKAELHFIDSSKEAFLWKDNSGKGNPTNAYYFETSVFMEDLFFMFRVWMEMSCMQVRFRKNLVDFVMNHIKIKNRDSFSREYLRSIFNKSRFIPPQVVRRVRTSFVRFIDHIDKNYSF